MDEYYKKLLDGSEILVKNNILTKDGDKYFITEYGTRKGMNFLFDYIHKKNNMIPDPSLTGSRKMWNKIEELGVFKSIDENCAKYTFFGEQLIIFLWLYYLDLNNNVVKDPLFVKYNENDIDVIDSLINKFKENQ